MQTACLRHMGKKLLVALTLEGKFAGEGLQSIDEDDDMLSAMARELVERNGIGESADAVWKALNAGHQKLFPNAGAGRPVVLDEIDPTHPEEVRGQFVPSIFGQEASVLGRRGRRPRSAIPEQGSLFSLT